MEKTLMNEMLSLANIHVPENRISLIEGGSNDFDLGWFDDQAGGKKRKSKKGKKSKKSKKSSKKRGGAKKSLRGGDGCPGSSYSGHKNAAHASHGKKKSKKGSKKRKGSKKKKSKRGGSRRQSGGFIRYDDEFNAF